MDANSTQNQEQKTSENTELKMILKVRRFTPGGGSLLLKRFNTPEGTPTERLEIEIEGHVIQVIRYNSADNDMIFALDHTALVCDFGDAAGWLLRALLNQPTD